ncbi:MAG: hypothetical protein A3I78_05270 [Gammaproteobacteria bacterium RIFCSPLOWO2_02_FULL_56_15]|nr:MAG: hypothetical protein A3I78_05270 [Gammaproteobacteria bacterium RIFCSPLOWO2_02_FULL_56_15]
MKLSKLVQAVSLAGLLCAASTAGAVDAAASGLVVGEPTLSFAVFDVTGAYAGKRICYVCEFQDDPNILGFFQEANEETADLIVKLDELYKANKDSKFKAVAVVVAGMDAKPWLEELKQAKGIEIPLVVLKKGQKDVAVRMYKLDPAVKNTFLVNINRLVKANISGVNPEDFGMVESAMQQMLAQQ